MNLKNLRKARGWTQKMLAERAGIDQASISRIEKGYDGVTLRMLSDLSEALDAEVADILREPIKDPETDATDAISSDDPVESSQSSRQALKLNIRLLRKSKGWTLVELANSVGVSVPHLSGVERGKKNLNNQLIIRLASALDVRPNDLIAPDLIDSSDEVEVDDLYTELLEVFRSLPPERRPAWLSMLRGVIAETRG